MFYSGDSVVLDVTTNPQDDVLVGQTLKRPLSSEHISEVLKHDRKDDTSHSLPHVSENENFQGFGPGNLTSQSNSFVFLLAKKKKVSQGIFHLIISPR